MDGLTSDQLGTFLLWLAFGVGLYGLIAGGVGIPGRRWLLLESVRRAVLANALLAVAATGVLVYALYTRDYRLAYVSGHVSNDLSAFYTFTTLWGGNSGSLLFWYCLFSLYMGVAALLHRRKREGTLLPATHVCALVICLFFLGLMIFVPSSQPFRTIDDLAEYEQGVARGIVYDGKELNPLLQDPVMAIHPPMLYLGFVGMGVPFCFAMGALLSGCLGNAWIRLCRVYTMFAWTALTLGVTLGGFWAYRELGWGGYWGWDPVENASFLPWLTATAFLHSVMVQEKYGMYRVWNTLLVYLTFTLTILGTFITRSGLLISVHTFAENRVIGYTFLGFLAFTLLAWLVLIYLRWDRLQSEHRLHSLASREFLFLLNNVVLVGLAIAILWGTLYPMFSEWLTGTKRTVGPPWYDMVTRPLFLGLILLTALGQAMSWKKTSKNNLLRNLTGPTLASLLLTGGLVLKGVTSGWALISYFGCFLVAGVTFLEFGRGIAARRRIHGEGFVRALGSLFVRNHRRYGGYFIHMAIILMVWGITSHQTFQIHGKGVVLARGETYSLGRHTLRLVDFGRRDSPSIQASHVTLELLEGDRLITKLHPEIRYFPEYSRKSGQPTHTTEVAYYHDGFDDVYVAPASIDVDGQRATFHFYANPRVRLIWLGALGVLLGGFFLMLPWNRIRRPRKPIDPERGVEAAIQRKKAMLS